jgi:uncharacterized lipoprotein YmbA
MRSRLPLSAVATVAGLVLFGGCVLKRSKSAQVYVLEPVAARGAAALAERPRAVVGVMRVTVPAWIDRPQITTRSAGSQIAADEFSRWGEPVAKGVQRVVTDNLAALLPDRRVVGAPFPAGETVDYRVAIAITELARQAEGAVLLEARWAVLGRKGETFLQRGSSHRANPAAAGVGGTVAGANEALAGLSRDIADALSALPLPPPPEDK